MTEQSTPTTTARIAVIGAGYWGKNLVRNFAELGALAAVVDPDAAVVSDLTARHGGVGRTEDEVLQDPLIQGVAIAAPAPMHYDLARRALLAGKDVFVEKPLALDVAAAEDLVRLAGETGRRLMVGHLLHYHPVFLRLKEMVAAGELGRVLYVYSNRLSLGKIRREEDVLWSFAPHDLSMVLGLADEEPTSVTAAGTMLFDPRIADTAHVHLEFASGLRGHVFVSWAHPFKEQKLVVIGERGMAVFDDTHPDWGRKLTVYRNPVDTSTGSPTAVKVSPEYVEAPAGEPLKAECAHFLACIRDRTKPRTDGEEGVRVLRVLAAASDALARQISRPA